MLDNPVNPTWVLYIYGPTLFGAVSRRLKMRSVGFEQVQH